MKRPASSMSPMILLKDGSPSMVIGASGASRIISSILQVVTNVFQRKMNLAAALAAPRLHPDVGGLMLEKGFAKRDADALALRGYAPSLGTRPGLYFGGVQALMVDQASGRVTGAADPRRRGVAVTE